MASKCGCLAANTLHEVDSIEFTITKYSCWCRLRSSEKIYKQSRHLSMKPHGCTLTFHCGLYQAFRFLRCWCRNVGLLSSCLWIYQSKIIGGHGKCKLFCQRGCQRTSDTFVEGLEKTLRIKLLSGVVTRALWNKGSGWIAKQSWSGLQRCRDFCHPIAKYQQVFEAFRGNGPGRSPLFACRSDYNLPKYVPELKRTKHEQHWRKGNVASNGFLNSGHACKYGEDPSIVFNVANLPI